MKENKKVLCVDLDGTLVFNDTVQESIIALLKKNIFYGVLFPWWLLRGHAYFKRQVAKRVSLHPKNMLYNQALIDFIVAERQKGRKTVLVTASDQSIAEGVATFLGIFDEVIGSDGKTSYAGKNKLVVMQEKYGRQGFDYAGNSPVDLKVWPGSDAIVVVSSDRKLLKKIRYLDKPLVHFPGILLSFFDVVYFLRIDKWVRNLLVFMPFLFLGASFLPTVGLFFIFGLLTSTVSILADLLDLFSDRQHERKKKKPIPSGKIMVKEGVIVALLMGLLGFLLAGFYSREMVLYLFGYFVFAMIDILFLTKLLTSRLLGWVGLLLLPLLIAMTLYTHFT